MSTSLSSLSLVIDEAIEAVSDIGMLSKIEESLDTMLLESSDPLRSRVLGVMGIGFDVEGDGGSSRNGVLGD